MGFTRLLDPKDFYGLDYADLCPECGTEVGYNVADLVDDKVVCVECSTKFSPCDFCSDYNKVNSCPSCDEAIAKAKESM